MKKKRILLGLLLIGITLILTGCKAKQAITPEDFTIAANKKEYTIVERKLLSNYEEAKTIISAQIKKDNYIELFELKTEEDANNFYTSNKDHYEKEYKVKTITTENTGINYNKYTLTVKNNYIVISRINNTVILVEVDKKYKSEVKEFLKEIGY